MSIGNLGPQTADGMPIVAPSPLEGSRKNFFTQNWCDKTSWWQDSERVTEETLTDSGDHKTYTPATARAWIDVTHGKIFGEYALTETCGAAVTVNDVAKTEHSPDTTDGDFGIDYATGAVTFKDALQPTDVVVASYNFAKGSLFILAPDAGKKVRLTEVEIQLGTDVVMTDNLWFQMYAGPPGEKVPVSGPEVYKTIQDFVNDANKSYPTIPAVGGSGWRGTQVSQLIFSFDYKATIDLFSSWGMEIHVWLEHDTPFEGTVAVGTFYALSFDEQAAP
jgi:hypothetical protein